jgi:hypothetical protein
LENFINTCCKEGVGDSLDKATQFLFDWAFHFIKNKDVILKKIVNIQEYLNQGYIYVEYKDKKMIYYVVPFISDFEKIWSELQEFKKNTKSTDSCIVMFNNKDNLDKIMDKWDVIDKDPNLQLVFANPFSMMDKRWIIAPYTHSRITEPAALKKGLNALFDIVDDISEKSLLNLIKS